MPKQLRDEHTNGEGPSDGEKPLKKARFVWELKGKHHLKEAQKNNFDEDIPADKTDVSTNNAAEKINNNNISNASAVDNSEDVHDLETHGSSSQGKSGKSCNSCCLQTLLERTSNDLNNQLDELSSEIDFSMGTPNPKNQEYYLHKWQTRQIARGFVDNTINSVLETWSNLPLDAADLLDNYANDGQVEDDAILMAIQSHGLQSASARIDSNSTANHEVAPERNPGIEEFTHDNLENVENERMKAQASDTDGGSSSSRMNPVNQESLGMEDTMDFLNAAVSVAIQKKGLSYGY